MQEVKKEYVRSLRAGTVDMMIQRPESEEDQPVLMITDNLSMLCVYSSMWCHFMEEHDDVLLEDLVFLVRSCRKNQEAPWHKDYKKNRVRILHNLHVLHPALRTSLSICKDHLNNTTLANCDGFRFDSLLLPVGRWVINQFCNGATVSVFRSGGTP